MDYCKTNRRGNAEIDGSDEIGEARVSTLRRSRYSYRENAIHGLTSRQFLESRKNSDPLLPLGRSVRILAQSEFGAVRQKEFMRRELQLRPEVHLFEQLLLIPPRRNEELPSFRGYWKSCSPKHYVCWSRQLLPTSLYTRTVTQASAGARFAAESHSISWRPKRGYRRNAILSMARH
jgi:hypothetical protein